MVAELSDFHSLISGSLGYASHLQGGRCTVHVYGILLVIHTRSCQMTMTLMAVGKMMVTLEKTFSQMKTLTCSPGVCMNPF